MGGVRGRQSQTIPFGERRYKTHEFPSESSFALPAVTTAAKATKARWVTPEHIQPMSEATKDFDWWFTLMHEHFRQCFVANPVEQLTLLQTHCSPTFFHAIIKRAKSCGYPTHLIYNDINTYQYFVCNYYTRPSAMHELLGELTNLKNKNMKPVEAWNELYRLQVCHDAKASRIGAIALTERSKIDFFISAMKKEIRDFLLNLLYQAHPSVATVELAYDTTIRFEADHDRYADSSQKAEDNNDSQQVLLAKKQPPVPKSQNKGKPAALTAMHDSKGGQENSKRPRGENTVHLL